MHVHWRASSYAGAVVWASVSECAYWGLSALMLELLFGHVWGVQCCARCCSGHVSALLMQEPCWACAHGVFIAWMCFDPKLLIGSPLIGYLG